jgi:predicted Zn-dependent protease
MIVRVDTERLRRILAASLPAGARAAELFVESRVSLHVAVDDAADDPDNAVVERRWETGAHLRRFSEGRHDSFVLDAPTPESLEALALHPEGVSVEWLTGQARLGVTQDREAGALQATLVDASPTSRDGPWSAGALQAALELARGWRDRLRVHAEGLGATVDASAALASHVQEIVVLATDRDPARDTRSFADLTLHASLQRSGRSVAATQTLSASSAEALTALAGRECTAEDLVARALRGLESAAAPRGEMPVVFASPSGGFLLHEICGHLLEADHILRGASPFAGARGQAVASPLLTLADDGSITGMRGSTLFDDEGVAARRTPLIMEGTLVGYLSDRLTAFATNGISTGNGRRQSYRDAPMPRMTNLVIDAGAPGFDEIVSSTPSGLLVTRLGRGRVDPSTGRFALAVEEGFLIEQGRATAPVAGVVLRGAARELLQCIDAVGCDPVADSGAPVCVKEDQAIPFGIRQPTLRVAEVTVTGGEP